MRKSLTSLREADLARHPVWEYSEDARGNIVAAAVLDLPVSSLCSRFVACQISLQNGQKHWAELFNINLGNQRSTAHFLAISVLCGQQRFNLARYFDADYAERGPAALASFLNLSLQQVFPIAYDFGPYVTGSIIPTQGLISQQPAEKLSQEDLVKLSLE